MAFTEIATACIRQAIEGAADSNGFVPFDKFVKIALYNPDFGYYQADRKRVGRDRSTDFFTASSMKPAFGPILLEASIALLKQAGIHPNKARWIEIGPEPDAALLDGIANPFLETQSIRVGDALDLEGPLVVFSNELFDAQPFHSVIFKNGSWRERGIEINSQGIRFSESELTSPAIAVAVGTLPKVAPEGYTVDLPIQATDLLNQICREPWHGAFIAFDYGKTWKALSYDTHQGTARAYRNHQQTPDLLDAIGEQDLTVHICWDWLEASLQQNHFQSIELESQESFILKRAPNFVREAFAAGTGFSSQAKNQLRQLIHPSLMGQTFQALSGIRTID